MTITTESFPIHDRIPSGFTYANEMQVEEYNRTGGSINGASKIALVKGQYDDEDARIALRFRPPRSLEDVASHLGRQAVITVADYIAQYNAGYKAASRDYSAAWDSGTTSHAWDDGYLDRATRRPKWHLTYCLDHDNCGEGWSSFRDAGPRGEAS